jgi:hypothetical protein
MLKQHAADFKLVFILHDGNYKLWSHMDFECYKDRMQYIRGIRFYDAYYNITIIFSCIYQFIYPKFQQIRGSLFV